MAITLLKNKKKIEEITQSNHTYIPVGLTMSSDRVVVCAEFLNKTTVYNKEQLLAAMKRPDGVPLITVSNHHSCFDDPGLWGE